MSKDLPTTGTPSSNAAALEHIKNIENVLMETGFILSFLREFIRTRESGASVNGDALAGLCYMLKLADEKLFEAAEAELHEVKKHLAA